MATPSTALKEKLPAKAAGAKTSAATKAVSAKSTKPAKTLKGPKPAPKGAHKREKLVRDSFTIPKSEYEAMGQLKLRANALAVPAKKSELLRAGVKALAAMTDKAFLATLKSVPAIKTGRPAAVLPTKELPNGKAVAKAPHPAQPQRK